MELLVPYLLVALEAGKLPNLTQVNMVDHINGMSSEYADRIKAVMDSRNSELKIKVGI